MITVSSEWATQYQGKWLTKDKITDGLPDTHWHAGLRDFPNWMNYDLNIAQTITEVTIGKRTGLFFC